mmetsp:Transcript_16047/g.26208  ORF Transcript_16047/g.26208 Transcript_16047/m.26208 type:complete len:155 (+) Transcript_16047:449-913(+)
MSNELYRVDDKVLEEYKNFKLRRKHRWVTFGINDDGNGRIHVVKEVESDKSKGVEDLIRCLPEHDCRYVVYEHEYKTKDGRKTDKLFFINWNPRAAATQVQMDYLTGRPAIRGVCEGCFDLSASSGSDIKQGVLGDEAEDSEDEDGDDDDWMDQ